MNNEMYGTGWADVNWLSVAIGAFWAFPEEGCCWPRYEC